MQSKRILIGLVVVVVLVIAGGGAFFLLQDVPDVTEAQIDASACMQADAGQGCMRFPTISGDNLLGQTVTYPADFEGEYALAVVPFDRDQQVVADTWLPFVQEIAETHPDFSYYNIPVFPDIESGFRVLARAGLVMLIQDEHLREITTTVFLDNREDFLGALEIPDAETIQILLMDDEGAVIWRETGEFTELKGESLLEQIDRLITD